MICPKCGASVNDGALFCTVCGAKMVSEPAEMPAPEPVAMAVPEVCPKCGTPRTGNENFCTSCGAPLTSAAPAQPIVQTQEWVEAPQEPASQMAEPQSPFAAQSLSQAVQTQEAPRPASPVLEQPKTPVQPAFGNMPANLKEFVTRFSDDKTKKMMNAFSIVLYVFAAINLVVALLGGNLPLDAIILAAFGFWFQKGYDNRCAIAVLVYSILSVLLALMATGTLSGWLIVILGVTMFTTTQKAQKDFNNYKATGQPPVQ